MVSERNRQKGAMIITVALVLLFLLGVMGIAIDSGRWFIVKTELQTAVDSCALAAAQELNGATGAKDRATSAAITAGTLNRVSLQSTAAAFATADVTFSDTLNGTFDRSIADSSARYARCTRARADAPLLLQALSAFSGDAAFSNPINVQAVAVATLAPAQTTCAIPIGLCSKVGGYQPGEWLDGAVNSGEAVTGQFRWLDFTGNGGGAKELNNVLRGEGTCSLPDLNTVVGKPGNVASAAHAYNSRFGLYQGTGGPPADGIPDLTGYGWYSDTAITQPPYPNKYPDFVSKRASHAPYQGDNKDPDTKGLNTVGKTYAGSLATAGGNRRIVVAPIVDCAAFDGLSGSGTIPIQGMACILLLHPIKPGAGAASQKMWVEYRGLANASDSPCASSGLVGGTSGPRVPGLVQ